MMHSLFVCLSYDCCSASYSLICHHYELPSQQYCPCLQFLSSKNSRLEYNSSTTYHLLAMQCLLSTLFVLNAVFSHR